MLSTISMILEGLGLIGLIYGYIKKNRNLMLISALLLWFGSGLEDFVRGWKSVPGPT